jgi:hypothetical protein
MISRVGSGRKYHKNGLFPRYQGLYEETKFSSGESSFNSGPRASGYGDEWLGCSAGLKDFIILKIPTCEV